MSKNEIMQKISLRACQLTAVAQAIAELDGRDKLSYGDSLDALETAISLASLLEQDGQTLLNDVAESGTIYYAEVLEAVSAAEALVDLAEKVSRDNPRSVETFFNLAYIVERIMRRTRDQLAAEVESLETA